MISRFCSCEVLNSGPSTQSSFFCPYHSKLALKHRRADRVVLTLERFRALCLRTRPESNLKSSDRWEKNNNKNEKKKKHKDQSCRDVVSLGTDREWNRRSHTVTCQMMKSTIPGFWKRKNDQLGGEEPSSLCPSANRTAERGGSGRLWWAGVERLLPLLVRRLN